MLLGASLRLAVYLGAVVALSSTAIVLKLYFERRELEAPHGQVATGIHLFQDFMIVPLLLVVPLLAGTLRGREPAADRRPRRRRRGAQGRGVAVVVAVLGFPARTRILAACGLAQTGEVSFVLVRSGHAHGLLDARHRGPDDAFHPAGDLSGAALGERLVRT